MPDPILAQYPTKYDGNRETIDLSRVMTYDERTIDPSVLERIGSDTKEITGLQLRRCFNRDGQIRLERELLQRNPPPGTQLIATGGASNPDKIEVQVGYFRILE